MRDLSRFEQRVLDEVRRHPGWPQHVVAYRVYGHGYGSSHVTQAAQRLQALGLIQMRFMKHERTRNGGNVWMLDPTENAS